MMFKPHDFLLTVRISEPKSTGKQNARIKNREDGSLTAVDLVERIDFIEPKENE